MGPRSRRPLSPAERMRRYRARRRAAGLRVVARWALGKPRWSDHRIAEARSLALHALAARRIAADPRLLERARATLRRWLARYPGQAPAALREWNALLGQPWEEVLGRATELSEDGARLRQSSPLATLLSDDERRRVHEAFRP